MSLPERADVHITRSGSILVNGVIIGNVVDYTVSGEPRGDSIAEMRVTFRPTSVTYGTPIETQSDVDIQKAIENARARNKT